MVALLQKVLQLYASRQLAQSAAGAGEGGADGLLNQLLAADEAEWAAIVRQQAQQGDIRWAGTGGVGVGVVWGEVQCRVPW